MAEAQLYSKTHTANWVSWQLNRSWIITADRKNDFRPDNALTTKRTTALHSKVTNMMPQSPELNRGVWRDLGMKI
ncbi:hypothetical protein K4039_08750 [Lyngbya sp. CCAP 1446/10]|uniref:hypothetical protein n=1 Tax=Lyngbya sp. CCAP 1446/10 TaxID=439293 RepID=UPI002238E9E2|nr:hypothetical protein [Lyngbya sp. CCAP 1446/10]MCW6050169.1 hypothetical protein [Lyngbya sp. CCAP 1446/10]